MTDADIFALPGSSIGRFYPYACTVAIGEPQHAASMRHELAIAGFTAQNSHVVSGDEVVSRHEAFKQRQTNDERFSAKPVSLERDYENEYLAAARAGACVLIVRTPTTILQRRIKNILIERGGSAIRFYHQAGIDDL